MVKFALLSLVSLPLVMPSTASPYAMDSAQDWLIISQHHHGNVGHAPTAQPLPQEQVKELPLPLSQSSEEPGQLLPGSGLGHDPAAWQQLDPPGAHLPLSFPPLVWLPPPRPLPGSPTLSFSIQPQSNSQEPEPLWPDGRARVISQKQYWRSPMRQTWWQSRSWVKFLVQHPSLPVLNEFWHHQSCTGMKGH